MRVGTSAVILLLVVVACTTETAETLSNESTSTMEVSTTTTLPDTTTTTSPPTTTTTLPPTTTTLLASNFDWSLITYEDLVSWESDFGSAPDGLMESLSTCEGGHMGIGTMTQILVSEVEPLAEMTIAVLDGTGSSVGEASLAWDRWDTTALMVLGLANGLLDAFPDHPAAELIDEIDDHYISATLSASLIASIGFDTESGEADPETIEVWFPDFLDAATGMSNPTSFVEIPGNADAYCP